MNKVTQILAMCILLAFGGSCSTSYKAKPLPFKSPNAYPNRTEIAGAVIGARAYVDPKEAKEAFGFDIRGAGMLPVQVVFDNQGSHPLEINGSQTFLEDGEGNLWPILSSEMAYERATKYAQTNDTFKEGAYGAFLGGAAGAVIGAAVGIVTGENVAVSAGKGAAAGAAAGGSLGGIKGYNSDNARLAVIDDLRQKSLQSKAIEPNGLAYGFLFFPGEAQSAKQLRLQVRETDTNSVQVRLLDF